MGDDYSQAELSREQIDVLSGATVLDFGTNWCGHCRAAAPIIRAALDGHQQIRHIKVEDGKGRPLGRSYQVKLWPTLIFLQDGIEVARLIRPTEAASISAAIARIAAP